MSRSRASRKNKLSQLLLKESSAKVMAASRLHKAPSRVDQHGDSSTKSSSDAALESLLPLKFEQLLASNESTPVKKNLHSGSKQPVVNSLSVNAAIPGFVIPLFQLPTLGRCLPNCQRPEVMESYSDLFAELIALNPGSLEVVSCALVPVASKMRFCFKSTPVCQTWLGICAHGNPVVVKRMSAFTQHSRSLFDMALRIYNDQQSSPLTRPAGFVNEIKGCGSYGNELVVVSTLCESNIAQYVTFKVMTMAKEAQIRIVTQLVRQLLNGR